VFTSLQDRTMFELIDKALKIFFIVWIYYIIFTTIPNDWLPF